MCVHILVHAKYMYCCIKGLHYITLYFVKDGVTPLEIAAQEGHAETVKRLLKECVDINHQNKVMSTSH